MKVYLDNCCYNRPYDDQTQLRISLESQAKLQIQNMIRAGQIELASSYVLLYENSKNPYESRKNAIRSFVQENVSTYVDVDKSEEIRQIADGIISTPTEFIREWEVSCDDDN